MKVGFAYNLKRSNTNPDDINQEFDSPIVIDTIKNSLEELGHTVIPIEADEDAFSKLRDNRNNIDIVFNIAEGLRGNARESQIPTYCELLNIPYTHSNPTTNAISLSKSFTKLVLKGSGVLTPNFQIITKENEEVDNELKFPLIVKPNSNGSSQGIFNDSVVEDKNALKKAIKKVLENFDKEVLIEEYIDGREFTVSMFGNGTIDILPIVEQRFEFLPKGSKKIAGYELKWIYEDHLNNLHDAYECPAKVSEQLKNQIEETSRRIYRSLEVRDCARIDFRLSDNNELYFIEINCLPGLNPNENEISYFPIAARTAGYSYKEIIGKILNSALKRYPHLKS